MGHDRQTWEPLPFEYVPGVQGTGSAKGVVHWYPEAHGVQKVAPAKLYVPEGQMEHVPAERTAKYPRSHGVDWAWFGHSWPLSHTEHVV